MEELFKELERIEKVTNYLNAVKFEFGIFDEDDNLEETISVYNLDGTVSTAKMKLSEIMYLTEKGTITIPAKPILRRVFQKINYELPEFLTDIFNKIREEKWGTTQLRDRLQWFNTRINEFFIPTAITEIIASDNVISGLLGEEEEQKYTYDLRKLKKFIKSKVFFTF